MNDVIYKQGDNAEVLYFLKRGRLTVETLVQIDTFNKFPIG